MAGNALWEALMALLFPQEPCRCPLCGGETAQADRLCSRCTGQAVVHQPPLCPKCGRQGVASGLCPGCSHTPRHFDRGRAVFVYDGTIRKSVHRMKFQGDWYLCRFFARAMADCLAGLDWDADVIVPVPTHLLRLLDRGCNIPGRMARCLSRMTGLPVRSRVLRRTAWRGRMPGLDAARRREAAWSAYGRGRDGDIAGKNVLLVDDIMTTGATLDACSALLKQAGAARVYVLAAAGGYTALPEEEGAEGAMNHGG